MTPGAIRRAPPPGACLLPAPLPRPAAPRAVRRAAGSCPGRLRLASLLEASRLAGPGSDVGGAVPKPRARPRRRPFGRARSVAGGAQLPAGPGGRSWARRGPPRRAEAGRAAGFAAKRLASEGRRKDLGRDAAATVLVSPRRASGGERRAEMLEVLVLKVSERPTPAGRPLPAQGPPRLVTPGFGPAGGLAGWGSGPPTADPQHEISVQVCPGVVWDSVKSYSLFGGNSWIY